jgi:hypothetical protein
MGCGCNKGSKGGRKPFNSFQEPVRVVSSQSTRTAIANAQLQAQALGINSSPAAMDAEKRKLEKLRRDAIRKSLNR